MSCIKYLFPLQTYFLPSHLEISQNQFKWKFFENFNLKKGIGYHTAVKAANLGANVIAACSHSKKQCSNAFQKVKLDKNTSGKIQHRRLDLGSFDDVRRFSNEINQDFERIDILINNAARLSKSFYFALEYLGRWDPKNYLLRKARNWYFKESRYNFIYKKTPRLVKWSFWNNNQNSKISFRIKKD